MRKLVDPVGVRYGRLVVTKNLGTINRKRRVLSLCDCGSVFEVVLDNLKSGNTLSCGCLRKEVTAVRARIHGQRQSKLYRIHSAMLQRCNNPNSKDYPRYGGRGIHVCDEWQNSFASFSTWAESTGYVEPLEIDRRDVDMGYFPENCQWVNQVFQARNRRTRTHSSKYTGVYLDKKTQKWVAGITVYKKRSILGFFESENEAWKARCLFIDTNNLKGFQTNQ